MKLFELTGVNAQKLKVRSVNEAGERVKLPFKELPYDSVLSIHKNIGTGKKEEVLLNLIVATENLVDYSPDKKSDFKPFPNMTDLPVVLKGKSKYFILDGHHRLNNDFIYGKKSAMCYVVELKSHDGISSYAMSIINS